MADARSTRNTFAAIAVALAIVVTSAAACDPVPPASVIGCDVASTRLTVTASASLDPSCTYTAGIDITGSNLVLDCRGAFVQSPPGTPGVGILLHTTVDDPQHDVTVRNCNVRSFVNGIKVTRDGFRDLAAGHEYDQQTRHIVIEKSTVADTHGVGVYVDGYVTDVTLRGLTIHDAGSTGVYLETGSRGNVVADNTITHNGYVENGPDGQLFTFNGLQFRYWGTGREGLAIDGSRDNLVVANRFSANAAGGIYLYKNCGEYPDSGRYFERRYGSSGNRIALNTFTGGRNGVWVGSRMGENTLPMACTDPAYITDGATRIVLDSAPDNAILSNAFDDVTFGVRVEDDGTTVEGNRFSGTRTDSLAVLVGTRYRTSTLDHPVTGTTLRANESTIAGNADPYRWAFGETSTTAVGNLALGQPSPLCAGVAPAADPFVMVRFLAYEPPGSPVTPTPDLTETPPPVQPPCSP